MDDKNNKKQPLTDEQFDEMLRMAVTERFEREMAALPPDEEIEKLYPFSERHEQRMAELFGQKPRRNYSVLRKPLKIAAVFVLLMALSFSVLLINEDVRAAVRGTVIEWYEQFTRFVFRSGDGASVDSSLLPILRPTYIPDGFYEVSETMFGTMTILEYTNDDGVLLIFDKTPLGESTLAVSTYDVQYYEKEHGGITYHVFASLVEDRPTNIVWEQEGFSLLINGYLDPDILMDMALSVEAVGWLE